MKVLVSAFTPFNNETNNYSYEVLKYVNGVDKIVVDVVYDKCYQVLNDSFDLKQYDLIIALGEARKRVNLTLELKAYNLSNCSLKDNEGTLKTNCIIDKTKNEILHTTIEYKKLKNIIEFSNDPGRFVCNNLYFHLLANYPNKSIFIHIPDCNNDINKYKEFAQQIRQIIEKFK